VEEFLAAAGAERVRLEAEIADANGRSARARAAVGSHRVMVAMLLEAQQELGEMRREAEVEAEQILADAERRAQEIERGTVAQAAPVTEMAFAATARSADGPAVAPSATGRFAPPATFVPGEHGASGPLIDLAGERTEGAGDDDYFDFLRGALTDDRPLGPAPE